MFGPAEACFNAVSFVIQAWQGYQEAFESLAELLDRCSQYLSRLHYYVRGGMDAELSKVSCQHLQLLVEICDHAIKLRKRWKRFKVFTKLLFLNDSAINDLLHMMDGLVDEEGRLVTAQTFEFASEAATNSRRNFAINNQIDGKIDVLMEDRTNQWKQKETRRRREIILRALAFDDDKMNFAKREPEPYWLTVYHNYRNLAIQGTGRWIFNEPKFAAWETGPPGTPPILAIEGAEGSGKSFLTSAIIRRLRKKGSNECSGPRNLVAFYFLEGDPKEELKNADNLGVIAKSLVWQLAQIDKTYLKSVVNICQKYEDFDPHEITNQLLLENGTLSRIDATVFIIIEGFGDVIADAVLKFLEKVSALPADQDVRVLLTGEPRGIAQLKNGNITFETIAISTKNRPDVEKYLDTYMDKIEALKDTNRLGVSELRRKICDTLCDKTAGDYFKMDTILKQIRDLDYVHDIDRVLEEAGKERSKHILGEIEQLNRTRTPKEIAEINEIILWILYGRQWLGPKQMNAVLYVKTGELSLLSLEAKFQTKYSLFKVDSEGLVDFRSSEIAGLIPERQRYYSEDPSPATAQKIQLSEVRMIKHFLGTVCPQDIYAKFNFDEFFDRKLSRRKEYICRDDKDTAEVKLAVTCLSILTEERDRRHERLRPYAMNNFLRHLKATDLALADREWKRAVGPRLVKLFSDDKSIDTLLWTPNQNEDEIAFGHRVRSIWIESDEAVDEILRWLRNSAVTSEVSGDARTWIADVTSGLKPDGHLLQHAARRLATHWLREPSPVALIRHAFFFVLGFLDKQTSQLKDTNGDLGEDTTLLPPLGKVLEIEEWARAALGVDRKDAMWEMQMGSLLDYFFYSSDAEKRYRHALELDPFNWRATYNLATMVDSTEEAITLLKSEVQRCALDDEWLRNHKEAFANMIFELGRRYWEEGEYDLAVQFYKQSIQADMTGYERALAILEHYEAEERWSDISDTLQIIQQGPEEDEDNLAEMVVEVAESEPLHNILFRAIAETDMLERVYNTAVATATKRHMYDKAFYIQYYYAIFLYQYPQNEDRAVALWESALKDTLPRSSLNVETTLPSLITKLGPIYLHRARTASQDTDARNYLQKISDLMPEEAAENNIVFPSKLYLARYYHVKGSETKAKQVTRSIIKVALEILANGEDDIDCTAYRKLLLAFLPLDDDKNALAACVQIILQNRRTAHSHADSPIEGDEDPSPYYADCDGECGRRLGLEAGSVLWLCKDCIGVSFDDACFRKLRDGALAKRICDRSHDFLRVPVPSAEKLDNVPLDWVSVGVKPVSFKDWVGELRRVYVEFDREVSK